MNKLDLETSEKLSYVETQIEEMKKIRWRNEVDIYVNENTQWTEDDKLEADSKVRQYNKQNDNLTKAILALGKLQTELKK